MSVILLDAFIFHILKSNQFVMTLRYNRNISFFSWWECLLPSPPPVNCCPRCPFICPSLSQSLTLSWCTPHFIIHWEKWLQGNSLTFCSFSLYSYIKRELTVLLIYFYMHWIAFPLPFQGLHFLNNASSLLSPQFLCLFINLCTRIASFVLE